MSNIFYITLNIYFPQLFFTWRFPENNYIVYLNKVDICFKKRFGKDRRIEFKAQIRLIIEIFEINEIF